MPSVFAPCRFAMRHGAKWLWGLACPVGSRLGGNHPAEHLQIDIEGKAFLVKGCIIKQDNGYLMMEEGAYSRKALLDGLDC